MLIQLILPFLMGLQVPIPTPNPINPTPTPIATVNVKSMSALRSAGPIARSINLAGYYSPNDGGGGTFVWTPNSTLPDDCGTVIQPKANTGSPNGRWIRSIGTGPYNLKWFGAVGNGGSHTLAGEISSGAVPSLSTIQALVPAAQANWDSDVVAVELAKVVVPANGTCYIPAGTYISSLQSWDMGGRSKITWNGSGTATVMDATYDPTQGPMNIGMLFAPYDMAGWQMGPTQVYPQDDTIVVGTNKVTIKSGVDISNLHVGDNVFWQDGRTDFQQNFGEFNQITAINGNTITFRYPWLRDYTSHVAEYGGTVTGGPYTTPAIGSNITLPVDYSVYTDNVTPSLGDAVSLGNDVYMYIGPGTDAGTSVFQNVGRGNSMTTIPTGTHVAGVCGLFKATVATSDITMSNMNIIGCWDGIQVANTINLTFNNVNIIMQRYPDTPRGGLFFDGDGCRQVNFNNCVFTASTNRESQWGRSCSGVNFKNCTFNNIAQAFSEYTNDCSMVNCSMTIDGSTVDAPNSAIDIGETCGGINISNCNITATNLTHGVFGTDDIQNFTYFHGPSISINNNMISAIDCDSIFAGTYGIAWRPTTISNNTITGTFGSLGKIGQVVSPPRICLVSPLVTMIGNQISGNFDFVLVAAASCDNLDFENNTLVWNGLYQGGNWGGTIANSQGPGLFPAKQQLTMINNTFWNFPYDSNIYHMFNFQCPWTSGLNISNTFINSVGGPFSNFILKLTTTGNATVTQASSLPYIPGKG